MNKNFNFLRLAFCIFSFFFLFILSAYSQISAPASCTAFIGSPANGTSHFITVSWATVGGATSYQLQYSTDGSTWNNLTSGNVITYNHNTGSIGNLPYYYRVDATNGTNTSGYTTCAQYPIYSACNDTIPVLSNATSHSLEVRMQTAAPDSNGTGATYAIYCTTTSQYVQANGTLGTNAVYQSKATWGSTVTVTGLTASTNYCFYVDAQNNNGDIRYQLGNTLLATQTFDASSSLNTGSTGPTTKWFSPGTCTGGGMTWQSTGGCSGGTGTGVVGFTSSPGEYNGCFLRSPTVNCTGLSSMTMTFDITNTASSLGDSIYFNIWSNVSNQYYPPCNPCGSVVSTINDLPASNLQLNVARTCQEITVVFDLTSIPLADRSSLLFYFNPYFLEFSGTPFDVLLDNIGFSGGAATACLSTIACTAATIKNNPTNETVCAGSNTIFGISTGGSVASYQWEVSTNSGGSWTNINNGGVYSNATTDTLIISGVPSGFNGYEYRCAVTGTCSGTPTSTAAILNLLGIPTITGSITGNTTVCSGSTNTYSIGAVSGATSYSWTLPSGWTGTSTINSINATASTNAGTISVTADDLCGNSSPVTLPVTVNQAPIAGTISVVKDSICTGTVAHLNLTGNSGGNLTWQSSGSPTGFTDISGVTGTSYNPTINQSTYYRVIAANGNCADTSAPLKILTYPAPVATFTFTISGGTVTFNSSGSTGASHYLWDFNDGDTSSAPDPVHTYTSDSTYHVCLTVTNNTNCTFTQCNNVVEISTGVDDLFNNANWIVYPNPFHDYILIEYNLNESSVATVTDILGRAVIKTNIAAGTGEARIDLLFNSSNGIYFLNLISSDGRAETKKLLKN
jgi:PKD repeat protein